MNRASLADMRKALVLVDGLKKAGILFVPVPVLNETHRIKLGNMVNEALQVILDEAEQEESTATK